MLFVRKGSVGLGGDTRQGVYKSEKVASREGGFLPRGFNDWRL